MTSDSTALIAIAMAANTGRSKRTKPLSATAGAEPPAARERPSPTNTITGIRIVPSAPSGSRMKILSSSQVSFRSPRHITVFSPQSRIEWPVTVRNTSSSVGSVVRKSATRMR